MQRKVGKGCVTCCKYKTEEHVVLQLMHRGRHWIPVVSISQLVFVNESFPIFLDGAVSPIMLLLFIVH